MHTKMPKPKDVDAYIAASGGEARPKLEELRQIIRSTVPEAEEGISWNMSYYKYHGELAWFAAYKNHVNFGIDLAVLQSEDRKMLADNGYVTGERTIQIRSDQEVPAATIQELLKARARMNEARRAA